MLDNIINIILHLDRHLANLINHYGHWSYFILFMTIFAETGLILTPFLPGDSLLFAAGLITAHSTLNIHLLVLNLIIAATSGNIVNYCTGYKIGHLLFKDNDAIIFKKRYLEKTHAFYQQYGKKALVISRFLPFIRTYAPFIAGMSKMGFWSFCWYSLISATLWVILLLYGSYFFGNIIWVKNNFSLIIIIIIAASIGWPIVKYLYRKKAHS